MALHCAGAWSADCDGKICPALPMSWTGRGLLGEEELERSLSESGSRYRMWNMELLLMVQHAAASVPSAAPLEVQNHVRSLLQGTARKERKYLANFRSRWNAKYGSLRVEDAVDVAERRQKVGLTRSSAL